MDFDLTTKISEGFEWSPMCYHMKNDKTKIHVRQVFCPDCNEPLFTDSLYHMLEHEIVEVLCNDIRFNDGEYDFSIKGFDEMSILWHERIDKHICGNSIIMLWSS